MKLLLCFICCFAFCIQKEEVQLNEDNIFKEADLLRSNNNKTNKEEISKIPFNWPVDIENIKQVMFIETDTAEITLIKKGNIKSIHKGLVLFVDKTKKAVWVQHTIEGGAMYVSILQGVDEIGVNQGDQIRAGAVLGQGQVITICVTNPEIDKKISIDMMFPFLKKDKIKVLNKIKLS